MTIFIPVEIVWFIKGIDGYGFGKDKNLYNFKLTRKVKQSTNGGSIGYWIGKKFYSLNKLRPLLYKKEIDCPF